MAMTACYPNYDMGLPSTQSMSLHHHHSNHASAMQQQSSRTVNLLSQNSPQNQQPPHKDYTIPLHVDCSVEYELPNQAKPPPGARVEPLLMIHPCYFRKMESQRRSPFINNMPNSSSTRSANITNPQSSVTATSAAPTNGHMSSSRRPNVLASSSSSVVVAQSSAKNQSSAHLMTNSNVISSHQNHMHQQQQQQQQQQQSQPPTHMTHRSQNLQHQQAPTTTHHQAMQAQIDDYVQRQMVHISQQTQYQHQPQPNSQYNAMQNQQQHQQMRSNPSDWDLYMNVSNPNMLGKVNIPNQNAYKKSGKRQLAATCANTYSTSHFKEGSLPNGIIRWDDKTASMAAIPRDYQSGPESITSIHPQQQQHQQQTAKTSNNSSASLYRGASSSQQHAVHMNGKHDRDPMLSGGCIYNNNNNSNSNLNASNLATSGLWEPIQKSPMAAIPNSKYQAGPESIPNSNHSSNNTSSNNKVTGMTHRQPTGATVIHHSHYPQQQQQQQSSQIQQQQQQQQHILRNDKIMNTNNSSSNLNNNSTTNNNNNVITVKYRQYRNSHRMHPYMMTAPSVNSALSGVSPYFPQLNGSFQQMQQVSCYNV